MGVQEATTVRSAVAIIGTATRRVMLQRRLSNSAVATRALPQMETSDPGVKTTDHVPQLISIGCRAATLSFSLGVTMTVANSVMALTLLRGLPQAKTSRNVPFTCLKA